MDFQELPDEIKQALKQIVTGECDHEGEYQQVAKLTPEDHKKFLEFRFERDKLKRQYDVHKSSIELLTAQRDKLQTTWWEYIYETYQLPSNKTYRIDKDSLIMRQKEDA